MPAQLRQRCLRSMRGQMRKVKVGYEENEIGVSMKRLVLLMLTDEVRLLRMSTNYDCKLPGAGCPGCHGTPPSMTTMPLTSCRGEACNSGRRPQWPRTLNVTLCEIVVLLNKVVILLRLLKSNVLESYVGLGDLVRYCKGLRIHCIYFISCITCRSDFCLSGTVLVAVNFSHL